MDARLFGVSPAYFISAFTDRFTPEQCVSAVAELRELGFTGYQLEVFHPDTLARWVEDGTRRVVEAGRKLGLRPSQFVGHFLLHSFDGPDSLRSSSGIKEMEQVVRMLSEFPECGVITVPLPRFVAEQSASDARGNYGAMFDACANKLRRMLEVVEGSGRRMALEILPGALVSGSDGYLRLRDAVGPSLGYNFDSGHAWAQKEPVEFLPEKLAGSIYGTHLCDNDGGVNESLRPGRGTIGWDATIDSLLKSGYPGAIDLEIKCAPSDVATEYSEGLRYIQERIERCEGGGAGSGG
jgi:sugar phosphate isomerase/epimerase